MEPLGRLGLHPAGKALVEPEVVPPGHGDEVAEPLVRHLVGDDAEDAAPRASAELVAGSNSRRLSKNVMPPQFSIAPPKAAGHRDQVELGQRIFHAEIVVEIAQQLGRAVEREAALGALPAVVTTPTVTPSTSAVIRSSSPAVSTNR